MNREQFFSSLVKKFLQINLLRLKNVFSTQRFNSWVKNELLSLPFLNLINAYPMMGQSAFRQLCFELQTKESCIIEKMRREEGVEGHFL